MSLIIPQYARAPFIAPGRRNRKVHWNAALSKAIRGLGRYEREDWRRGLVFPSGLFGLTRNYLAKKNNPGCTCCDTTPDNSCADALDCVDGAWGGGSMPTDIEIETPTMTDDLCENWSGDCSDFAGTYILTWTGFVYDYDELWPFGGPCSAGQDGINIEMDILCSTLSCVYEARIQLNSRQSPTTNISQCYRYQPTTTPKGTALPWSFDFVDNTCTTAPGASVAEACTLTGPFVVTGFA